MAPLILQTTGDDSRDAVHRAVGPAREEGAEGTVAAKRRLPADHGRDVRREQRRHGLSAFLKKLPFAS